MEQKHRATGVWLLSWFINIQIEKGALEPQVTLIGTFALFIYFQNKLGFLFFFSFLFIPSHWKGEKEKRFWIHSIFWTPQMNGTLHTHLEQRERGKWTPTGPHAPDQKTWIQCKNFPKWLDHHYQKLAITTPRNKKCLSHTVWLGIFPAFFFFLNCLPHREKEG